MLTIALDDARNIVEIMPNPILVIAPDLRVQTANRAFCRMFQVGCLKRRGSFSLNCVMARGTSLPFWKSSKRSSAREAASAISRSSRTTPDGPPRH